MSNHQDRTLLRNYLKRYTSERRQLTKLNWRLKELKDDLHTPLKAVRIDGMPKGTERSDRIAESMAKIERVEEDIEKQINKTINTLRDIRAVVGLLPRDSKERVIVEMRYIDGYSWDYIENKGGLYMSRASIFEYERRAIDYLLDKKFVRRKINAWNRKDRHF